MDIREIIDHTHLDGDVDSVQHHSVLRCSPGLPAGRGVRGVVGDLEDSDDCQLVEGRSAAVQDDPLICGLTGIQRVILTVYHKI